MVLLYAKGHTGKHCEPIIGKTRLMKMVFLFDKEIRPKFNLRKSIPDTALPKFEPYDYGPFSAQVYEDLEFLVEMGFVEVTSAEDTELLEEEVQEYEYWQVKSGEDEEEIGEFQEKFALTDLGRDFVKDEIMPILSKEQWDVLDEFKRRCTYADLRTLLRYVYTKYPKMITKSKISERIMKY
jgi:uncharacterized protein YwgA